MAESNKDILAEQLTQQIDDLSIKNEASSSCANCRKKVINPNTCNKCDLAIQYCNAACKKRHRSKHKQDCERRVTELHEEELERERRAAELHDEKLFKMPPPNEDCPICMLPLPPLETGYKYKSCCGKIICSGCIHAVRKRDGVGLCPFCRTPAPKSDEEMFKQYRKRIEVDDAAAIYDMGCCYSVGTYGLPRDRAVALELWHQAAKLEHSAAHYNIGVANENGYGVERDEKKAVHYYELAAMKGNVYARHNLGCSEGRAGNVDRALKHFMIAAAAGGTDSLEMIKQMFMDGDIAKDDYAKALRAYQTHLVEFQSPPRDEAAAFVDSYKYY